MKTGPQRIDKYDAKVAATAVNLIVAGRLPGMRAAFADPTNMSALVDKENQIQTRLNGQVTPVPTCYYGFYLNFGREIWKLMHKGIDGTALTQAAQDLKDKYVNYGLDSAVLIDIALNVFTQVVT